MRIISFALWGNSPKYYIGALKNIQLARTIYPDWQVWLYLPGLPIHPIVEYIHGATKHGIDLSHVHLKLEPEGFEGWKGMFARFQAASDPECEVMLSRDCDSRLSKREKEAVDEWLASDKGFHIMRDHPWHGSKILGGMWGVKKGILPDMCKLMNEWNKEDRWQTDQDFLNAVVYPRVQSNSMVHDPFFEHKPFPSRRDGLSFVGQSFDENDLPVAEHQEALRRHLKGHGEVVRI